MESPVAAASPPAARLLDLTRLVSRVGKGPHTGIDRVEAAYLLRLLDEPTPLFSLVQTRFFDALLDRNGTRALADRLFGTVPWGRPSLGSHLRRKLRPEQRAAEADLRRLALAVSTGSRLARMLVRHLPRGTTYLAVGQGKALRGPVFDAVHAIEGGRVSVLLHDTIPLDHPDHMMPKSVDAFSGWIRLLSHRADLVICNSEATRASAERHFKAIGPVPPMIVAHLGIDMPEQPDASKLPPEFDTAQPFFVSLGTITARKNHGLLLDIWEHFDRTLPQEDIPTLAIIGQRGWMNDALFERLDTSPMIGKHVFEYAGLDDHATAALVQRARALLMPSMAEGFGLPPGEALLLGTAVIANDLPIYHEVFGNNLVYLDVGDMYPWAEQILDLARAEKKVPKAAGGAGISLPTWQDHFNLVLKVT